MTESERELTRVMEYAELPPGVGRWTHLTTDDLSDVRSGRVHRGLGAALAAGLLAVVAVFAGLTLTRAPQAAKQVTRTPSVVIHSSQSPTRAVPTTNTPLPSHGVQASAIATHPPAPTS